MQKITTDYGFVFKEQGMKLTIEIDDGMMAELDAALQRANARAQAEIDQGRGGPGATLMEEKPEEYLAREVKGCLRNFLMNDHLLYLDEQVEASKRVEADRINTALNKVPSKA
jgi:hypothetical protein